LALDDAEPDGLPGAGRCWIGALRPCGGGTLVPLGAHFFEAFFSFQSVRTQFGFGKRSVMVRDRQVAHANIQAESAGR
jgi:hypothetical protein